MGKVRESQPAAEVDLDKTDELPVLDMMRLSAAEADPGRLEPVTSTSDAERETRVDLPALIDSVQQAEARIAQQSARQEELERDLRVARDRIDESAREVLRLGGEAQALRTTLGTREEALARALHTVGERDQAIAELRRQQGELQQELAEAVAAAARNKSEFAATESFLHDEHEATRARLTDDLIATRTRLGEELAQARTNLGQELSEVRSQLEAGRQELDAAQRVIADLRTRIAQGEQALGATQREAALYRKQSTQFLENLRSQEWRRHHGETLFREMDARLAVTRAEGAAVAAEAASLATQFAEAQARLEERARELRDLNLALDRSQDLARQQGTELVQARESCGAVQRDLEDSRARLSGIEQELQAVRAAFETERKEAEIRMEQERVALNATIAHRDRSLLEERNSMAQLQTDLVSLQSAQAENLARIADIDRALGEALRQKSVDEQTLRSQGSALEAARSDMAAYQERINALEGDLRRVTAQLDEVRRPIEEAEADIRQLRADLEGKSQEAESAREEARRLQGQLERSRAALEEREFLIRRLERSASNSAQVLGRLQSSIERLGTAQSAGEADMPPAAAPFAPTLIRIDNGSTTTYALGPRTRIGRSPESEIRVESSSVSRHHALIISHARHTIVEDLNSTNGVAINGRKISRHKLKDGDVIIIGDAQFKFVDSGALLPESNPVSFATS